MTQLWRLLFHIQTSDTCFQTIPKTLSSHQPEAASGSGSSFADEAAYWDEGVLWHISEFVNISM